MITGLMFFLGCAMFATLGATATLVTLNVKKNRPSPTPTPDLLTPWQVHQLEVETGIIPADTPFCHVHRTSGTCEPCKTDTRTPAVTSNPFLLASDVIRTGPFTATTYTARKLPDPMPATAYTHLTTLMTRSGPKYMAQCEVCNTHITNSDRHEGATWMSMHMDCSPPAPPTPSKEVPQ